MLKDRIGNSVIKIASTQSTNNYASRQLAEKEVKSGTVFLAYDQTNGRGQQNNSWESTPGKNLTFSIVLTPDFLKIEDQFMLSKVVCLGLGKFLSRQVKGVKIKWPNDMYVDNRKIAGILIEHSIVNGGLAHSILGIGLNVNQERFESDAPNPVSLVQLTGTPGDLDSLLEAVLHHIDDYYQLLKQGKHELINQEFLERLYRMNEWHLFEDDEHQFSGRIIGVNHFGQLLIEDRRGNHHEYHFKQVHYVHGVA